MFHSLRTRPRRARLTRLGALLATAFGLLGSATPVLPVCEDPSGTAKLASRDLGPFALSPPASELMSGVPPFQGLGKTMLGSGTTLLFLDTATLAPDFPTGTLGGSLAEAPVTVRRDDNSWATYAAGSNGVVYAYNAVTKAPLWSKILRRGTCPSDSLTATPAVHLRRLSTPAFRAIFTHDVVYVATHYDSACGGSQTQNKVHALRADTGLTLWTFNATGLLEVDVIRRAVTLDVATDRIYVGAERTFSPSQHSLWALSALDGSVIWSQSAGRLLVTPRLAGDRLYVADVLGDVKAYAADTGAFHWSVSTGESTLENVHAEIRPPFGAQVAAVSTSGTIHVVRDDGSSGTPVHAITLPGGIVPVSAVAAEPSAGKYFVGADDGKLYQINVGTGAVEASREVDAASGAAITDPSFVWEDTDADGALDDPRILATSSQGTIVKFCFPWEAPPADSDGDGSDDALDCHPLDPALISPAVEVLDVTATHLPGGETLLEWDAQASTAGASTVYDVIAGFTSGTGGMDFSSLACVANDITDTQFVDGGPLPAGQARYWLVRAYNACNTGHGTFGDAGQTPDPRDAIDSGMPCP